jgi:hypothetical protein
LYDIIAKLQVLSHLALSPESDRYAELVETSLFVLAKNNVEPSIIALCAGGNGEDREIILTYYRTCVRSFTKDEMVTDTSFAEVDAQYRLEGRRTSSV